MLGGLQLRALHKELVESGKMTDRQFHDAVLREDAIPIEMIRASLTNAEADPRLRNELAQFYDNDRPRQAGTRRRPRPTCPKGKRGRRARWPREAAGL